MPGFNSIDGIASNLNTSEIVEAIMKTEHWHVDFMQAQQAGKTNQITTYNSVSALILGLKAKVSTLMKTATYDKTNISVSDDSFVTAAASGKVIPGSYTISIDQLARNHQIASQGFDDINSTDIGTGIFKFKVGDGSEVTINIDSTNNTLEGLKNAINDADAGISASIINDGSTSNPYRLLLTAGKTGLTNEIVVTNELTGGETLDFNNSSFDIPETLKWSSAATSAVSLGPTASYTGSANKTYTFTVQGTGTSTVGSGDIYVDWTDGTNQGTIVVSEADVEVNLSGDGSDGLSLKFEAGTLVGGDTFQVQTFSPLIQKAQDAKVSMGSSDSGGSPVVITSSTNMISDLMPGMTLNLKKVTDEDTPNVTINADRDTEGIREVINQFISQYNEVMGTIDTYLDYDPETKKAGTLLGDGILMSIEYKLQSMISKNIPGTDSKYKMLADIGIRTYSSGDLAIVSNTKLTDAINNNLPDLIKLFTNWGDSDNSKVTFLGATNSTKVSTDSGYEVNITQAAMRGYLQGALIGNPSISPLVIDDSNNTIKLKVDGIVSDDIVLSSGTYNSWSELVTEIQSKIDQDSKIGSRGLEVSYVDLGDDTGYLKFTASSYGENSKVEMQAGATNSAHIILGIATGQSVYGKDVEGTINGEEAVGVGQILTGKDGNETTDGLRLKIELESSDLVGGADATVTFVKGIASQYDDILSSLTKSSDGLLARRSSSIQKQIDYTNERIDEEEKRLEIRREALYMKFYEMEKLLGQFNSESAYLETQLNQLSSNWMIGRSSGK